MEEEGPFWSLSTWALGESPTCAVWTRLTRVSETGTHRDSEHQDKAAQSKLGPGNRGGKAGWEEQTGWPELEAVPYLFFA